MIARQLNAPRPTAYAKAGGDRRSNRKTPYPLPDQFHDMVISAGKEFRHRYGMVDRSTAERLGRLFCSSITPRQQPGRPMTKEVATALRLLAEGIPWPAVYPQAQRRHNIA